MRTPPPDRPPILEFDRQLDIFDPYSVDSACTVIGCGGIGSHVTQVLARMGIQDLSLYDSDRVEPHNLPNQLFPIQSLGAPKAHALALECERNTGVAPKYYTVDYVGQDPLRGIVISGVDSMPARRTIWHQGVRYRDTIPWYIDGRMGGQIGTVLTVDPSDPDQVAWYEKTLVGEGEEDPCTAKAIGYNLFVLAGLIANQVKRLLRKESVHPRIDIDLVNVMTLTSEFT